MSEGIVTRRASDIRPLLLDRFRNAAAAYSLRPLTLSGQDNAVVKVRRSADDAEQDFNPAQINDGTLEQFVNAGDVAPADYGTGAAAAYSLRHVSDGYTGDVIRVRESTNNTEQDFNPTEITDGTLLAFCGAGDGLVTTWYDQSGNSNDATQATAASQPKIVSGGSLVTENGKPAIDFDGSNYYFEISTTMANQVANSTDKAVVVVSQSDGIGGAVRRRQLFFGNGNSTRVATFANTDTQLSFSANQFSNRINATEFDNTVQFLLYGDDVSGNQSLYLNGNLESSNSLGGTNNDIDVAEIGASSLSTQYWDGTIQEIIIYPSDQSSNRELIETNVNHYYSIYSQTNDGFVTTWYDQSGNSNDATQATAASQPKIVSAGSLVVENGKAALDFDGSDDYFEPTITGFQSIANLSSFVSITPTNAAAADAVGFTGWSFGKVDSPAGNALTFNANSGLVSNETLLFLFEDGTGRRLGSSLYARTANTQSLLSLFNLNSGTTVYAQGQSVSLNLSANMGTSTPSAPVNTLYTADDKVQIGAAYVNHLGGVTLFQPLKYQELIFYPDNRSSTRQQIESNINNHYGIY